MHQYSHPSSIYQADGSLKSYDTLPASSEENHYEDVYTYRETEVTGYVNTAALNTDDVKYDTLKDNDIVKYANVKDTEDVKYTNLSDIDNVQYVNIDEAVIIGNNDDTDPDDDITYLNLIT